MQTVSNIAVYIIGSFLTYSELSVLSLSNKRMLEQSELAKKLLSQREAKRIFTSNLLNFR